MKNIFLLTLIILFASCTAGNIADLSGKWTVALDHEDAGEAQGWAGKLYDTSINLPGTLDDAGLGNPDTLAVALEKEQLQHLRRKVSYTGSAWYSREFTVPDDWKGKIVELELERVIWITEVWVDGRKAEGCGESLVTPHRFDLTDLVRPGETQVMTIKVDNRQQYDISFGLTHAYTDHTQIVWNGVKGKILLTTKEQVSIEAVKVVPSEDLKSAEVTVSIMNRADKEQNCMLELRAVSKKSSAPDMSVAVMLAPGINETVIRYDMGENPALWSEFEPVLYTMSVSAESAGYTSSVTESFGMRSIRSVGNKMTINGKPLFLRGTLECCIFPLTGTPPTDRDSWKKVFSAAKDYGLNHLRFHSWCPPEAAFEVADEMGFYLQVELPVWMLNIGEDAETVDFLMREAGRISAEYGNHPSFAFFSLGNELQGDFTVLNDMLKEIKSKDSRHLYTTTTFTFEKGHGAGPEPCDDFYVTQWTDNGWVRGQGVFNKRRPLFNKDFRAPIKGIEKPLVTHEIGQYSVYPDMNEIDKYTGVLKPLNFLAIRNDLEKKGLIDKADDWLAASGALAAILYKEEIERALKTDGISGFQLLDLHDFPGQGTALVGLLNAFWESKGIISGKEFREFCSPEVPLLRFGKTVYDNTETFEANIEYANYSDSERENAVINWTMTTDSGACIASGHSEPKTLALGYNARLGKISVPFTSLESAVRCRIEVSVEGSDVRNSWSVWVYPSDPELDWGDVKYSTDFNETSALLSEGHKVLFNPDWKSVKGIEGKFVPVFWSPVHFPRQAATMGVLCDPSDKALKDFPTESHSDWQWWDLNINSTTMIVEPLSGGKAIVEMIDNFANNRRLALLYEGKVGEGKLMMASFDLHNDLEKRPVARQMLYSVLNYMNSPDFAPSELAGFDSMADAFGTASNIKQDAAGIY